MDKTLGSKPLERGKRNPERPSSELALGPLVACVGPKSYFSDTERKRLMKEAEFVAWNSNEEMLLISDINQENKRSEGYINCTGIALVGLDKTGRNISLLTHQSIKNFVLPEYIPKFTRKITEAMGDFSEHLDEHNPNISAMIFGGNYFDDKAATLTYETTGKHEQEEGSPTMGDDYRKAIKVLGALIQNSLHVKPRVAIGPNMVSGKEIEVVLDTKNRRLYIMRPIQPGLGTQVSFEPDEVDIRANIWKKDAE